MHGARVVHVIEALGGVETYARLLVEHWPGGAPFAFVLAHDGALAADLRARGHEVRIVAMPRSPLPWHIAAATLRLRAVLSELSPDVVHLHSSVAGIFGRLASLGRGTPVVYTPHAYFFLGRRGKGRLAFIAVERLLAKMCPALVAATSPSEARRATREVGVPTGMVRAVTNAVEAVEAPPRAHPQRPLRIGFAGRISYQKNPAMYLRMVSRLTATDSGLFTFDLVGTGHYPDDVAALARLMDREGVPPGALNCVPWLSRPDFLEWLDSCDVVVLTSRYESFGYTLAEASARGIPVVGTDVDGVRDVVQDGVNGHLVPPGDDQAMAVALWRFATDPAHYRSLSAGGLRVARERLGLERHVTQMQDLYADLGVARSWGDTAAATSSDRRTVEDRTG